MAGEITDYTVEIAGKSILVTGGGSGIGALLARNLASAGARVALVGRRQAPLDRTKCEIEDAGARCLAQSADMGDEGAVREVFACMHREMGGLDVLINCAAELGPIGPIAELVAEDWLRAVHANLRSTFLPMKIALESMLAVRRGCVITLSSAAARGETVAGISAYATVKAAIDRLTESAAAEVAGTGITVCALHPTPVATAMFEALRRATDGDRPDMRRLNDWSSRVLAGDIDGTATLTKTVRDIVASTTPVYNGMVLTC